MPARPPMGIETRRGGRSPSSARNSRTSPPSPSAALAPAPAPPPAITRASHVQPSASMRRHMTLPPAAAHVPYLPCTRGGGCRARSRARTRSPACPRGATSKAGAAAAPILAPTSGRTAQRAPAARARACATPEGVGSRAAGRGARPRSSRWSARAPKRLPRHAVHAMMHLPGGLGMRRARWDRHPATYCGMRGIEAIGPSDGTMTEADLIERARRGEDSAIHALYRRHAPRVYATIRRLAGDDSLAEDWAQEALVRAIRALPTFRGESQFSTWLHRIPVTSALHRRPPRPRRTAG